MIDRPAIHTLSMVDVHIITEYTHVIATKEKLSGRSEILSGKTGMAGSPLRGPPPKAPLSSVIRLHLEAETSPPYRNK